MIEGLKSLSKGALIGLAVGSYLAFCVFLVRCSPPQGDFIPAVSCEIAKLKCL